MTTNENEIDTDQVSIYHATPLWVVDHLMTEGPRPAARFPQRLHPQKLQEPLASPHALPPLVLQRPGALPLLGLKGWRGKLTLGQCQFRFHW